MFAKELPIALALVRLLASTKDREKILRELIGIGLILILVLIAVFASRFVRWKGRFCLMKNPIYKKLQNNWGLQI